MSKVYNVSELKAALNNLNLNVKETSKAKAKSNSNPFNITSMMNALTHIQSNTKRNAFKKLRNTAKAASRQNLLKSKNVLKQMRNTRRALDRAILLATKRNPTA